MASTWRKQKDAVKQQNAAAQEAANRAGQYQSNVAGALSDALNQYAANIGSVGTGNVGTYRNAAKQNAYSRYLQNAQANAQAARDNAVATAAGLTGGYGSSYAQTAADQLYNQQMDTAGVDAMLAALQAGQTADDALGYAQTTQAANQSGLEALMDALLNQEDLDLSAWQANTDRTTDNLSYAQSKAENARADNADFWSNVWNLAKGVGSAALTAYDGWKGYTQQQWENDLAERQFDFQQQQYNDSLMRSDNEDMTSALQTAFNQYYQGDTEGAKNILSRYGLDEGLFDNWTERTTNADKADVLQAAAQLAGSGNDTAANNLLALYGMDAGTAGSYGDISKAQLQAAVNEALANKSISGTGSSGSGSSRKSSGSSGTSGSSGSGTKSTGFTNAQLKSIAKDFSSMTESNPLYSFYKKTLEDAGWISTSGTSGSSSGGTSGTTGSTTGTRSSGLTKSVVDGNTTRYTSGGLSTRAEWAIPTNTKTMARNQAQELAAAGYSADEIISSLIDDGWNDAEIMEITKNLY